jgi:membrane protein implicated in regulation of membrane protease activity
MALSLADWILWIAAMGGLALLWFVPHLPVGAASAAALVVGAYIFYVNGFEWVGAVLLLFGVVGVSMWIYQRNKSRRERPSNP